MLSGVVSGDSSVDLSVDDLDSMARYALPRFCREAQSSQPLVDTSGEPINVTSKMDEANALSWNGMYALNPLKSLFDFHRGP